MKNLVRLSLIFLGSIFGTAATLNVAFAGGDAAKGEPLTAVCAACHSTDGNSPTPLFPKIAGIGEKYLFKQLQDIKSGERVIPEMTGLLNGYDEAQLWDIAAYFNSKTMQLSGAKAIKVKVNSGVEVDALKLGERVYRAGNHDTGVPACSGCHSPTGVGNDPAGFPRLGGQYAEYIEKQLKAFQAGERVNDGEAAIMRSVAKNMSAAEIKAVANYIAGLN